MAIAKAAEVIVRSLKGVASATYLSRRSASAKSARDPQDGKKGIFVSGMNNGRREGKTKTKTD
jgi:hypothetical protein